MTISLRLLLIVALCAIGPPAQAAEQEILLFIDGIATQHVSGSDADDDTTLAADLIYSFSQGNFRILGEYSYSDEENELERLQFGWQINDDITVWLGRIHNPDNYWNITFHHGQYLQTAISRPWMDRFEDEGGPVTSHTTGILIEATHERADHSGLEIKFAAGAGAHYEEDLEPFDVLSPESQHDFTTQARVSYLPEVGQQNQFGLLASFSSISVSNCHTVTSSTQFSRIKQTNLGAYVDWAFDSRRVIANFKNVHNELKGARDDSFWSAYLYAEQDLGEMFQLYGRVDHVDGEERSDYLRILDESISNQFILGIRWDFLKRHALTLELIRREFSTGPDRTNAALQWSTVLP